MNAQLTGSRPFTNSFPNENYCIKFVRTISTRRTRWCCGIGHLTIFLLCIYTSFDILVCQSAANLTRIFVRDRWRNIQESICWGVRTPLQYIQPRFDKAEKYAGGRFSPSITRLPRFARPIVPASASRPPFKILPNRALLNM
jgi:hypothetical protein